VHRRGAFGQPVTSRRRHDLLAAGAQDGHILDQTLAAHAETPGKFAARDRRSGLPQAFDDAVAPPVGRIRRRTLERFVLRRLLDGVMGHVLSAV
jgi:hypothetical protein